jgi:transposase-like protein
MRITAHYGPENKRRVLRCTTCKARFSERKGTPLFVTRLPEEKVVAILSHLAEGCGVRKTSRLVEVNKDTVARYALRAGEHAQQLHDELVAFSPADTRDPVRRKMGLRRQEGRKLRSR